MKKALQVLIFISLTSLFVLMGIDSARASAPPPPPPAHGETGDQPGNAPVGSGIGLFVLAATVYGIWRVRGNSVRDSV